MFRVASDDATLPSDATYRFTRIVATCLVPVLTVAFLILYSQPDDTGAHFAWSINPEMTALIMGSGYLAGAYYFSRMAMGKTWHRVGVPLPAVSVFAADMMLLTILHWDSFTGDRVAFYLWVFLYAVTPPLVLGIWLWNRREDPRTLGSSDTAVPRWIMQALFWAGIISLVTALWLFLFPDSAAERWPWQVSDLTARVTAGWIALGGTAAVILGRDSRWSAWRIPFETTLIWSMLVALGIARAHKNFDWNEISSWFFVALVGIWVVSFVTVIVYMESRKRSQRES